jgi:hypothetical protein
VRSLGIVLRDGLELRVSDGELAVGISIVSGHLNGSASSAKKMTTGTTMSQMAACTAVTDRRLYGVMAIRAKSNSTATTMNKNHTEALADTTPRHDITTNVA